ncbi:Uncharacterized protein BM_BM978 [Brugia malayi]|uniref:Uncharacterized protein n=1 Tax=Brugia malayi TaxID=6279 RepID=A0A4E9FSH5_BRUMA|nr:Uncharacterized protein BM_BM978 [Brugia malayi]VIP00210.1 Uncharacterized protein BM_BM978 [Brugia malayi]
MKDRFNRVRRKNNSIFILCRGALRSLNFLLSCAEVEKLLTATFNIMLTLIVWIGIYHTKKDSNSVFYYKFDPVHNHTTENEIVDGMARALEACK